MYARDPIAEAKSIDQASLSLYSLYSDSSMQKIKILSKLPKTEFATEWV